MNPVARELPINIEAEQALIGAVLINNNAFHNASDLVEAHHFGEAVHGQIWATFARHINAGQVVTPIVLKADLPMDQSVGNMTLAQYLVRMATEATTIINAADYARAIRDMAIRRDMVVIGEDLVNAAYQAPKDQTPLEHVEACEAKLFAIAGGGVAETNAVPFEVALQKALEQAQAAFQSGRGLTGISTGLPSVDRMTGGLAASDLIVLAGRPAMGKTSLATNIAFNVASMFSPATETEAQRGGVVGFFSMEMAAEQLVTRIISEQIEVSSSAIRRGQITQQQLEAMICCSQAIHSVPLHIDQTGGLSISKLAARARRLKRKHGLDLIVIDYIQLMTGNKSTGNRVQEVTEITTGLKALAKELNVPILALSQLSRQVENREDKRPQLADLRESGSIEQDADVVVFVYRDEYYAERLLNDTDSKDYDKAVHRYETVRGKAEVIVAKNRHAATGTTDLAFQAEFTRFSELAHHDDDGRYAA